MLLRSTQLSIHLRDKLASLYVLHGNEPLLTIETADAIRATARERGFTEYIVFVITPSFHWDDLFLAAGNLSLFGSQKLIDLRIPSGKLDRDGGEVLKRYCSRLPIGILTLVTLPELDWKTKKGAWFSALTAIGVTIECNAPPITSLSAWIAERLACQQQSAPHSALKFIASHVEGSLLAAHQEIRKLGLIYPKGTITLEQVQTAVLNVTRYDINALRSALSANDTVRCIRILDGLKSEGTPPPLVLWVLATASRAQYRHTPTRRSTARTSLLHAARIDRIIKGVAHGDIWDELLQLSLRLTKTS